MTARVMCCLLAALCLPALPLRAAAEEAATETITLEIVDPEGKPVAGYPVRLGAPPGVTRYGHAMPEGRSDAKGRLTLKGLVPGPWKVYPMGSGTHGRGRPLPLKAGAPMARVVVHAFVRVEGRALDPQGNPLAGCAVRIRRVPPRPDWDVRIGQQTPGGEHLVRQVLTDAQGRFAFEKYPWSEPSQLRIDPPPARPQRLHPYIAHAFRPGKAVLDVRLPLAPTIRCRVRDTHGRPIAGASIKASVQRPPHRGRSVDVFLMLPSGGAGTTDAEGRAELGPFAEDANVTLWLTGPIEHGRQSWFRLKHEGVRPAAEDLELTLERGVMVTGTVAGVPALALRGWAIKGQPSRGERQEHAFDGSSTAFTLGPFPPGTVDLMIGYARGSRREQRTPLASYGGHRTPVMAPATGIVLRRSVAREFKVHVDTSLPLYASFVDSLGNTHGASRAAGSRTPVHFRHVASGPGVLRIRTKDDMLQVWREGVDPADGEVTAILVRAEPISGRIRDLPSEVAGVVIARRGFVRVQARLDANGRFATPPLAPGPWTLEFDVRRPLGGIVESVSAVVAGTRDVSTRWSPDR